MEIKVPHQIGDMGQWRRDWPLMSYRERVLAIVHAKIDNLRVGDGGWAAKILREVIDEIEALR